jgi:hypothetical protein
MSTVISRGALGMPDDRVDGRADEPRPDDPNRSNGSTDSGTRSSSSADEFDSLVLDEGFVRGGPYEPPARTRLAIARYGNQQTSWRHGGGLQGPSQRRGSSGSAPRKSRSVGRKASPPRRPDRSAQRALPASVSSKLPLIVSVVVVLIAAFLMLR